MAAFARVWVMGHRIARCFALVKAKRGEGSVGSQLDGRRG